MWTQVLVEGLGLGIPCENGAKLSELFLNRTFDLETGPVYVDERGVHQLDVDVYSYDVNQQKLIVRHGHMQRLPPQRSLFQHRCPQNSVVLITKSDIGR